MFKDVTSTYLTNADFEGSYEVHSYPTSSGTNKRAVYRPNGWTVSYTSGNQYDNSALDNECLYWSNFSSLTTAPEGGNKTYWIRLYNDSGKGQRLEISQTVTLKGTFVFSSYAYFNDTSNGTAYIQINNNSNRASVSTNATWGKISKSFTNATESSTTLTCGAWHKQNTGHAVVGFDNVKLEWNLTQSLTDLLSEANDFYTAEGSSYTALKAVIDVTDPSSTDADELESQYNTLATALDLAKNHRKPWLAAWTTANTNYSDATYSNVTGSEKTALKTEIDKTEPSEADDYDTAKSALETTNSAFIAAKTNYDKYAAEVANAEQLGVSSIPALDLSSNYTTKLNALIVLEDAAVITGFPQNITNRLVDSWDTSNAEDKTDTEHWSGTEHTYYNKYLASGFTMYAKKTVTLPAGNYVLKAAARCNKRNEESGYYLGVTVDGSSQIKELYTATNGGTGKGIATNGTASYDSGTFANSGDGYGWEWRFVGFTLTDTKDVELKISANILAGGWVSFSDIQLLTTSDTEKALVTILLNDEITTASAIDKTTNVGTGAFQIPTSAADALGSAIGTAQGVSEAAASKSTSQISDAIDVLKTAEETFANVTLNAPAEGQRIKIVNCTSASAFDYSGNALTFYANPEQSEGGYGYQFKLAPNDAFAQNFIFTPVAGQKNQYTMSFIDNDGTTRYVCTQYGYNENASGDKNRIRTTTNSEYALKVRVDVTSTANVWKLYNTEAGKNIGTNGKSNSDFFTNADRSDLTFSVASQASVPVTIADGVNFATRIFPFTPTLPSGVIAYSCETKDEKYLTLSEVAEPAANVPYILYAENGSTGTLTGYGTATADTYTEGLLTGVYTSTLAPVGKYVLQNLPEKDGETDYGVAFYIVQEGNQPNVGAYRCYLTAPTSARALYFNFDDTNAVETIKALTSGKNTIYNAEGKVVPSLQKGLNIIKTSDGVIRKVMVK